MRRLVAAALTLWTASLPALANDAGAPETPRIFVVGRGTAEAVPDLASVSVGVSNRAPTASAALDATSAAAAKVIDAAKGAAIASRDIQTGNVSLQPAFRTVPNPGGGSEQRPDGYTASNTVSLRVRDIGRLGDVLRVAVDGGANRIGGIEFGLADPRGMQLKAIDSAVKNARQQADTIAAASGVKLGRILEMSYGERVQSPVPLGRSRLAAMALPAPSVPVESGSLEASAEVSVVWAIE